jgi:putative nucleotidyltransferase with HDIG domain
MRDGIPRILTREKIKKIVQTDIVAKTSPITKEIQVSLGIPIVHNKEVVLFINLENFDSPSAFDDNDIILGQKLASYLVACHQILILKEKVEKREIIIAQTNEMSASLAQSQKNQNLENVDQTMLDLFINNISILNPHIVMIWAEESNRTIVFPNDTKEEIIRELKEHIINLIPYIKLNKYAIGTFHGKNLLIIHKNIPLKKNLHVSLYIALTRELPWSSIALNYINSTISSITIYGKNLMYLKTINTTQEETLKMLGKVLEARDIETKGHTERTANLTRLLAQKLGFTDIKGIVWGAYLHDIGKLAIPDKILLKPGKLTPEEFEVIKSHVVHGYNLIKHIEGLSETTKNVVLYHHEKWDGSGYVHGLKGENIPLEARIFAVVDVYDALISERPYKKPWSHDEALQEIKRSAGYHFDPEVVEAFEEVIREKNRKNK